MKKFWNWIRNDAGERVLRLEGPIDSESFWGDEVTPRAFREELNAETGDITVYINSPGGNVFAAAEIYTMLGEYPGAVTVKIDAIAASAASVVAMAGDTVLMSPVSMLMIHDPATIAMGNAKDMEKAISTLNEIKESIINAYAAKTGLTRNRISKLMSDETWLNARKAVELGFADAILFSDQKKPEEENADAEDTDGGDTGKEAASEDVSSAWEQEATLYSSRLMSETILNRLGYYDMGNIGDSSGADAAAESATAADDIGDRVNNSGEDGAIPHDTPDGLTDSPGDAEDIVIGLDGTTSDGSVPYLILEKQLAYLR